MGVLGLAIAALAVMASVTGVSAITGAVMGSRREIGAVKGFLWGLFLPVVGVGRVWISDKLTPGDTRAAVVREGQPRAAEPECCQTAIRPG